MHKLVSIIFLFLVSSVFSQSIENVDFRAEGKTIVVMYDFFHSKSDTAINVELVFKDQQGGVIAPKTITGDIKYVKPGESKRIVWDVLSDDITLSGKYKAFVIIQNRRLPVYLKSVVIGTQIWTTENLNVSHFRNGDAIPEAKTAEEWKAAGNANRPAWCYYDNDQKNGKKYGKLYNWYAVNDTRGLAPDGWHVPTDKEWPVLSTFLGGVDVAGTKMKSTDCWSSNGNGVNSSDFSGLPGGFRSSSGAFGSVGYFGDWWSASESDESSAFYRLLSSVYSGIGRNYIAKHSGLSVRCIKD